MKWQFLKLMILIMYCSHGQSQKSTELSIADLDILQQKIETCGIAFYEYKTGMKFFFPVRNEKDYETKLLKEYRIKMKPADKEDKKTYYQMLSGKTFEIKKIKDPSENNSGTVVLQSDDIELIYKFYKSRKLLKEEAKAAQGTNLILPYAVYLQDFEDFKSKYLNLKTDLFYNFPLKDVKYQKVKITDITLGATHDKPIHIVFENQNKDQGTVDICHCGTNIPYGLFTNYSFSKYFITEDPKGKTTPEFWTLITKGEIALGMNKDEIISALGEPVKTVEEIKQKEKKTITKCTLSYKNSTVILEENKTVAIQKNS